MPVKLINFVLFSSTMEVLNSSHSVSVLKFILNAFIFKRQLRADMFSVLSNLYVRLGSRWLFARLGVHYFGVYWVLRSLIRKPQRKLNK